MQQVNAHLGYTLLHFFPSHVQSAKIEKLLAAFVAHRTSWSLSLSLLIPSGTDRIWVLVALIARILAIPSVAHTICDFCGEGVLLSVLGDLRLRTEA